MLTKLGAAIKAKAARAIVKLKSIFMKKAEPAEVYNADPDADVSSLDLNQ